MSQLGQIIRFTGTLTGLAGDIGSATPALGSITIAGGNNIGTIGAGNTITVNLDGTTNHAVQVGNVGGSLTSLAVGASGYLLVGSTGADPVFAALGVSNGISKTEGAGTLSIAGVSATTAAIGVVTLATNAEARAGTDTSKVITPDDLNYKLGSLTNHALPIGAGAAASVNWLAVGANGETLMGSTGADCGWTSSPQFGGSVTALNDITSTAGSVNSLAGSLITRDATNTATGPNLYFQKVRVAATIQSGDSLGVQRFTGYDGVGYISGAKITSTNSGTVAANRIAGDLKFYTHPDSVIALPSEPLLRMTINPDGSLILADAYSTAATPSGTAKVSLIDSNGLIYGIAGTSGQVLQGGASPSFSTATYPSTVAIGDVLIASADNTIGVVTGATTAGHVLMANGAGSAPSFQALPASGIVNLVGDDAGTATGTNVTVAGGTNIGTTGAGSTLTVNLDSTITLTGVNATTFDTNVVAAGTTLSGTTWAADGTDANIGMTITPKGTGGVTVTSGNVSLTSGNLLLPTTSSSVGQIQWNAVSYMHTYGTGTSTGNLFLGYNAGNYTLTTASALRNIGIGTTALASITTQTDTIAIGYNAGNGPMVSSGSANIFIGSNAGAGTGYNYQLTGNIAIGHNAYAFGAPNAATSRVTAIGYNACKRAYGAPTVTAMGYNVLGGTYCGANASVVIGEAACSQISGGIINNSTMIGMNVGLKLGSAGSIASFSYNDVYGYNALSTLDNHWNNVRYNCFFGSLSASKIVAPELQYNSFFGFNSGGSLNNNQYSTNHNTFIGANAGATMTSGNAISYNTFIGSGAGNAYVAGSNTGSCICIGYNASGSSTESNILRIGNATGTSSGNLNAAYVCGIYGRTPAGTLNIALIDSNNQLGSTATLPPSLGGAMTWTEVTGTSQAAAVNNGYITNNVALVTVTLPSTAAVGQRVAITGKGAGLWQLAQNAGQTVHFGSFDTTTGATGSVTASVRYDCIEVQCTTANTDWVVIRSVGALVIA